MKYDLDTRDALASAEESFKSFAAFIHGRCPDHHAADLTERREVAKRGICGDDGRVVPTRQGLCPKCAGYVHETTPIRVQEATE